MFDDRLDVRARGRSHGLPRSRLQSTIAVSAPSPAVPVHQRGNRWRATSSVDVPELRAIAAKTAACILCRVRRFRSIRVWLAAARALVSVLTAVAVAAYILPAADSEFETVASDAALGQVVNAAHDIAVARSPDEIQSALRARSRQAQLWLWLVGANRHRIASSALPGLTRESLPGSNAALDLALSGRRSLPNETSSAPVVGLPVTLDDGSKAALIAYVPEEESPPGPRARCAARSFEARS